VPHAITAAEGPVEIIVVLDREGRRAHLDAGPSSASRHRDRTGVHVENGGPAPSH